MWNWRTEQRWIFINDYTLTHTHFFAHFMSMCQSRENAGMSIMNSSAKQTKIHKIKLGGEKRHDSCGGISEKCIMKSFLMTSILYCYITQS